MSYTAEQDPLCYPGTSVLRNRAGLVDQAALDEFETAMFSLRAREPWPSGGLTVGYYRALHRHLFQDVYDWAGEIRTIRIGKAGNWFCYPEYIKPELDTLFASADQQDWFKGLSAAPFARGVAGFLAHLNAIHPFREGNGRTQIALLSILTDLSGFAFNDDVLVPDRVLQAMVESFSGDDGKLTELVAGLIALQS